MNKYMDQLDDIDADNQKRQLNGWRTMESAPLDGSLVMVRIDNGRACIMLARGYFTIRPIWISSGYEVYPTHWQPLPSTEV